MKRIKLAVTHISGGKPEQRAIWSATTFSFNLNLKNKQNRTTKSTSLLFKPFWNQFWNPTGLNSSNSSKVVFGCIYQFLFIKENNERSISGYSIHNRFRIWFLLKEDRSRMNRSCFVAYHCFIFSSTVLHHFCHLLCELDKHPCS